MRVFLSDLAQCILTARDFYLVSHYIRSLPSSIRVARKWYLLADMKDRLSFTFDTGNSW